MRLVLYPAAAAALLLMPMGLHAADGASGTFRYAETTVTVSDAIAFRQDVNGRPQTVVALSDVKLDRQAVLDALDPSTGVLEQVQNGPGNVVLLRVGTAGKCGLYAFLSEKANNIDLGDSFAAQGGGTTGARVSGQCSSSGVQKSLDRTYEFQLTYDLPVTPIVAAAVLPAGGGEPGAAFLALVKAIQARDGKTALLHVPTEMANGTPGPEWFGALVSNYPKQATVTDGVAKRDRARLQIVGLDGEGKKITGTVEMRKLAATWRVRDISLFFAE